MTCVKDDPKLMQAARFNEYVDVRVLIETIVNFKIGNQRFLGRYSLQRQSKITPIVTGATVGMNLDAEFIHASVLTD